MMAGQAINTVEYGRDEIWKRIRETNGEWFSVTRIIAGDPINRRTVIGYLNSLVAAGAMEKVTGESSNDPHHFKLLRDFGVHAPRFNRKGALVTQGAGVENMWRTMRINKTFSSRDVAMMSTTDTVTVAEETVRKYVAYLLKAGYLKVLQKAIPGKTQAQYRLINDTGPLPPKVQNVKRIWDQNLKCVMAEV